MIKTVAVTGGAGQIAYQLIFRIAAGEIFGPVTKIHLKILEIPEALESLQGVVMELDDGCYPLLENVTIGSNPKEIFADVDLALLVGAKPRGPGMERKDLLLENSQIFKQQGLALNEVAKPDCVVLVIGNPCNTNAWIVQKFAPRLKNIFAMTRLDENRAKTMVSRATGMSLTQLGPLIIWGNHSTTMVADISHTNLKKTLPENWQDRVKKRGAEVIKARGKSSAASAAQAILDTARDIFQPRDGKHWYSLALQGVGNTYGIDPDLIFSYPCHTTQAGEVEIIQNLPLNAEIKKELHVSEKELQEERDTILQYF